MASERLVVASEASVSLEIFLWPISWYYFFHSSAALAMFSETLAFFSFSFFCAFSC